MAWAPACTSRQKLTSKSVPGGAMGSTSTSARFSRRSFARVMIWLLRAAMRWCGRWHGLATQRCGQQETATRRVAACQTQGGRWLLRIQSGPRPHDCEAGGVRMASGAAGAGMGACRLVSAVTPVPGGLGSQVKMSTRLSTLVRVFLGCFRAGAGRGGVPVGVGRDAGPRRVGVAGEDEHALVDLGRAHVQQLVRRPQRIAHSLGAPL